MGDKNMGLARLQALIESLRRRLNLNGSIFGNLKIDYFRSDFSDNDGRGEIVTFGTGTTTKGILAIALGTSPSSDGMLIRGFFDAATYLSGTFTAGATVYLAASAQLTTTAPSTSTEILRVAGVCTNTSKIIYFNPSADYLVIE